MKQFVRSVPAVLFLSVASLSLIALAGCGASGSSNTVTGPTAAKNIYAIQTSNNGDTEQDSVLVFSASVTGTTTATPTSTLTLPSGFSGYSLAIGPQGQIYVGGDTGGDFGEILEYTAGASGSATPTVTLSGSSASTATFTYPDEMAVNSAGTLVVSSDDGTVEAFASGFTAPSAPSQYLTWGVNNFNYWGTPIGVDTAGDIFYLDSGDYFDDYFGVSGSNPVIDVFAANATGATAPTRTITGTDTNPFTTLENIAVDGAGDVYVTNYNSTDDLNFPPPPDPSVKPGTYAANKRMQAKGPHGASHLMAHPHDSNGAGEPTEIIEFAAGASGTPTPTKRIGGAGATPNNTAIVEPEALAVDAASNLYYAEANGGYWLDTNPSALLEVFPSSATGNVAPAASITSTSLTSQNTTAVAVR
jgi:hypothetical protein